MVLALALLPATLHAATFTWDGTANTWPSAHWFDSGNTLVAGGNNSADSYLINGGTVSLAGHDTFGKSVTTTSLVPRNLEAPSMSLASQ